MSHSLNGNPKRGPCFVASHKASKNWTCSIALRKYLWKKQPMFDSVKFETWFYIRDITLYTGRCWSRGTLPLDQNLSQNVGQAGRYLAVLKFFKSLKALGRKYYLGTSVSNSTTHGCSLKALFYHSSHSIAIFLEKGCREAKVISWGPNEGGARFLFEMKFIISFKR